MFMRRREEADGVLDQAVMIAPDFTTASMMKVFAQEAWKGETSQRVHGPLGQRNLLRAYWLKERKRVSFLVVASLRRPAQHSVGEVFDCPLLAGGLALR